MSKYKWPLNLQLFADEEGPDDDGFEDDSLPEDDGFDFDDEPGEQDESDQEEAEDTKPAEEDTEPPAEPEWKLQVKFDKEDRELTREEAQRFAQLGMNQERAIARAREDAAREARDAYIAEQGYEWNGKPIKTEAEYKAAIAEREFLQKYENMPQEIVDELMASRRDREERAAERQAAQAKAQQEAEYSDFFDLFQQLNDRPFDSSKDVVPQAVWDANKNGTPLKFAYLQHHSAELRNQLKISKQNETNSKRAAIGGVSGNAGTRQKASDPFLAAFEED